MYKRIQKKKNTPQQRDVISEIKGSFNTEKKNVDFTVLNQKRNFI